MNEYKVIGFINKDIKSYKTKTGLTFIPNQISVGKKNKDGKTIYSYIDFMVWGKTAENMEQYCKKGDRILVIGHLTTRINEYQTRKTKLTELQVEQGYILNNKNLNQETKDVKTNLEFSNTTQADFEAEFSNTKQDLTDAINGD